MNRNEILEQTGSDVWQWIVDWFGNMSRKEILDECNQTWREDDNEEISNAIYDELEQDRLYS